MARPMAGYVAADGQKVPSVTTICSRFKESGGLLHWAYRMGSEGRDLREVRDAAAEAGTLAHMLVEASLRNQTIPAELARATPEIVEKAHQGFSNWLAWKQQTNLTIQAWETPLVCEHYRYGGTPDAIAYDVEGRLAVVDWKTGGVYVEALLQVAAYFHLFDDHGYAPKGTSGFHIGSFSRDHGDFVHRYFSELDRAWEQFVRFREAYDTSKVLERRLR